MKKGPLTRESLGEHIACIKRLRPDAQPAFGMLDATGLMRHLRFAMEASIGDPETADHSKRILRVILWVLFFRIFTRWPGGKIKAPPEATPVPEHAFEDEQRLLLDVMRRFVEKLESAPEERHVNPGLGPITVRNWSRLHGVHHQHHYRQFRLLD